MRRATVLGASLMILVSACGSGNDASPARPAASSEPTTDPSDASGGRIFFERYDPATDGTATYSVNPDGSDLQQLFPDGPSQFPQASPDGSEIGIFCCDEGAAHLIDAKSGDLRVIPAPDPTLETHCGFAWSSDGRWLACEVFGLDDPAKTGVYSIDASGGGELKQITSNPNGDDVPGAYSPDGTRIVFGRIEAKKGATGLFVANIDGTGLRKLSGSLVEFSNGRWSPSGDQIIFAARKSPDDHKAIWIVDADGGSLHQLQIDPHCGSPWSDLEAIGCYSPVWSPDGTRIAYVRSTPEGDDDGIFVADADGTDSVRVTAGMDDEPNWGPTPSP